MMAVSFYAIFTDNGDDGFTVTVPDLPGCTAEGWDFHDAMEQVTAAAEVWLEEAVAEHRPIPEGMPFDGLCRTLRRVPIACGPGSIVSYIRPRLPRGCS